MPTFFIFVYTDYFYPRDAMLARSLLSKVVCTSVRNAGIVSKRLNLS